MVIKEKKIAAQRKERRLQTVDRCRTGSYHRRLYIFQSKDGRRVKLTQFDNDGLMNIMRLRFRGNRLSLFGDVCRAGCSRSHFISQRQLEIAPTGQTYFKFRSVYSRTNISLHFPKLSSNFDQLVYLLKYILNTQIQSDYFNQQSYL